MTGGPGGAARQPVLLLHGLGGDCAQPWAYLASGQGLRRIAPDRRAHGATGYIGPEDAFTFDGLADDTVALLGRLGVTGPVVAAGVSMGAGEALNLAAYPLMARLLRRHGPEEGLARFEHTEAYQAVRAVSDSGAVSLRRQFTARDAMHRAVRLDRMLRSAPSPATAALREITRFVAQLSR